ncbi:MAG TPA: hypothetical protein VIM56_15140 [Rhizomicrobium sp.]
MTDRERHPMTPPPRNTRDNARHKAGEFFKEKEKRSAAVFEQMQTERDLSDAKTAKLRALRLAKEAADREAAQPADNAVETKAPDADS